MSGQAVCGALPWTTNLQSEALFQFTSDGDPYTTIARKIRVNEDAAVCQKLRLVRRKKCAFLDLANWSLVFRRVVAPLGQVARQNECMRQ